MQVNHRKEFLSMIDKNSANPYSREVKLNYLPTFFSAMERLAPSKIPPSKRLH